MSVPYTDYNVGSIPEILKMQESTQKWWIGNKTRHKHSLSEGDRILLYQGGEGGGKIVGCGELASSLKSNEGSRLDFVEIRNLKVWKNPVDIRTLLGGLTFVKSKKHWGAHLKGDIVSIREKDYAEIMRSMTPPS